MVAVTTTWKTIKGRISIPYRGCILRTRIFGTLLVLSFSVTLCGQNSGGSMRGEVQDTSRARIAAARVEAQLAGTNETRRVRSDARGEFSIEGLTPGAWHVTVDASGFATAGADVSITVSTIRDVVVTMAPAQVQQTTDVRALGSSITAQPIDLSSNVHQAIATTQDLEELALPARSFANIAYLAPGTEPVEPSDPTKARITAVSTGGSSGLNNELSVDGGDNSDDFIGGFLQNF